MNTVMLFLTAVCAVGSVIVCVPIVRSWTQKVSESDVSESLSPGIGKWLFLIGVATITLVISAVGLYRTFTRTTVTTENVEGFVRTWLDDDDLSVTKGKEDPNSYFSFDVLQPGNGLGMKVTRTKDHENELVFASKFFFPPVMKGQLTKLSAEQLDDLKENLVLELAKMNVGFQITVPDTIGLITHVPINGLTEKEFHGAIVTMDSANSVTDAAVLVYSRRLGIHIPEGTP